MIIDDYQQKRIFYDLCLEHLGHEINIVSYHGDNVAIECDTCGCVLLDTDRPIKSVILVSGKVREVLNLIYEGDAYPAWITVLEEDGEPCTYRDEDIAYYSANEEVTEDEFIEALGRQEGKIKYARYLQK